jgi:putative phosphonoacetaldehyde dehydrogenase
MLISNRIQNSDRSFEVINPYSREVVDTVPIASAEQVDYALNSSYRLKCNLPGFDRSQILSRAAKLIENQKNEFAQLISLESGLCIKHSLYEISRAINCLNYSVKQAELIDDVDLTSDFVSNHSQSDPKLSVISEPWDLAIGITPFNHPLNMVVHKVAPAIAAGTPIVIKPSEKTPLTAIKFGEILVACGLPENMLNIVVGIPAKTIVDQLVSYPGLDLVSFTGSVEVGKYIAAKMANNGNELKKYMPELGGNATFVVMDDCDVDLAANIALGAYANSGQRCTAIRKILLHDSIADDFLQKFVELASQIKYGDPMDPDVDMGTVISAEQAEIIQSRVENAVRDGARILLGNERDGALLAPTIVDNVSHSSELVVKETFGPVASIMRIHDIEDAISLIKSSRFRLAGSIATSNRDIVDSLHNSIQVGQFSWNGPPGYRTEEAPFGGFGDSGNGEKEGVIMMTRAMRRLRTFYEHRT